MFDLEEISESSYICYTAKSEQDRQVHVTAPHSRKQSSQLAKLAELCVLSTGYRVYGSAYVLSWIEECKVALRRKAGS